MKFMAFIFALLLAVFLITQSVEAPSASNKPVECLMANEVDPESITGSHLVVKVVEDAHDYYVTGYAWDHVQNEWVAMDYRVIDKKRAPEYVTPISCPAPYEIDKEASN